MITSNLSFMYFNSPDMQPEIATLLGYRDRAGALGVERFMKHYYLIAKEIGDLTRIFCAALEAEHQRKPKFRLPSIGLFQKSIAGFEVESGRLNIRSARDFLEDPVKILMLFQDVNLKFIFGFL